MTKSERILKYWEDKKAKRVKNRKRKNVYEILKGLSKSNFYVFIGLISLTMNLPKIIISLYSRLKLKGLLLLMKSDEKDIDNQLTKSVNFYDVRDKQTKLMLDKKGKCLGVKE